MSKARGAKLLEVRQQHAFLKAKPSPFVRSENSERNVMNRPVYEPSKHSNAMQPSTRAEVVRA